MFVVSFGAFGATATRDVVSIDVYSANLASWHLATTGRPWVDELDIPFLEDSPLREHFLRTAANGHETIARAPGVVAAGVPAHLLSQEATPKLAPASLTAAMLTAMSVLLLFLLMSRHLSRRDAVLAAAAFGFTTPVWSVAANGLWPHTLTVLGITGMAWAADTRRWWLVGLFGGVALWGRVHAALIVAVLGIWLGLKRLNVVLVARIGILSAGMLLGLCAWNRWVYGSWDPASAYLATHYASYAKTHGFDLGNQAGLWISPDRGLLWWTPTLLLLLPALVRSWRTLPDWACALCVAGVAYSMLQCLLNKYDGGDAFYGYRVGLEMLACATPALVLSARRVGAVARHLLGPVLAVQLVAIAVGACSNERFLLQPTGRYGDNTFIEAIERLGPLGWALLAAAVLLGVWGQRIWNRANPRHAEVPALLRSMTGRETVATELTLTGAEPSAPTRSRTTP